jgi:hypothetical protein
MVPTTSVLASRAMMSRVFLSCTALACGNYSNQDIDFQLALPARRDLSVILPNQSALVVEDSAEYFVATKQVTRQLNGLVDAVGVLVDAIRGYSPSERAENLRIWGPIPLRDKAPWELRLKMTLEAQPQNAASIQFEYSLDVHRSGTASWIPLVRGQFIPKSGEGRRKGTVELDMGPLRAAEYPVVEFGELSLLHAEFEASPAQNGVVMNMTKVSGERTTYAYSGTASGAGDMHFTVNDSTANISALEIWSRWTDSGSGRADARVVSNGPFGKAYRGVDCWGADSRAVYSRRDWDPKTHVGATDAACAFPGGP